jgi:geranylgeranyl diphosphate synthase type I
MTLSSLSSDLLPAVEDELQRAVSLAGGEGLGELHAMLAYHMGWQGEGAGPKATGKRIRPLLVLLACEAAGGHWREALPAAVAVELVHNFSLIHDDIEDDSSLRRGRNTVWKNWGVAQALNAGDTMFTLAHLSILHLEETTSPKTALSAARLLQETCLKLTQGQYLDISYESLRELPLEAYWPMINGKTAALLSACAELGALVSGADPARQASYRQFGHYLGLAFQAQDDLLGVWGDAALTGKSADSDLLTGKKSLPILYGLSLDGPFARRWRQGPVGANEAAELAHQLEAEGARGYTQETADRLTRQALGHLEAAEPKGEAGEALWELAYKLVRREG